MKNMSNFQPTVGGAVVSPTVNINNTFRVEVFRDELVLDSRVAERIQKKLKHIPPLQTSRTTRKVLIAARKVSVPKGTTFTLKDCDLVICADEFNANEGTISLEVNQRALLGKTGHQGRTLTIFCKKYTPGTGYLLSGGTGGQGLPGGQGLKGANGTNTHPDGYRGKQGQPGKPGMRGGRGGTLQVYYLDATGPQRPIDKSTATKGGGGGKGGNGGPGGEGGDPVNRYNNKGEKEGKKGLPGPVGGVGPTGPEGLAGSCTVTQVADERAFNLSRFLQIHPATKGWALQRAKQGEYLLRGAGGTNPNAVQNAWHELNEALLLDANSEEANRFKSMLLSNTNVLGINRFVDILPDFKQYEQAYIDYYPMMESLFAVTDQMLVSQQDTVKWRSELNLAVNRTKGLATALSLELAAESLAEKAAKEVEERAISKVNSNSEQLKQRKRELEMAGTDLLGPVITILGAAISVAAAIPTGGMSVVAGVAAFASFASVVLESDVVDMVGELTSKDGKQPTIDKLKKESKGFLDATKNVKGVITSIISFEKAITDIDKTFMNDEVYRKLLLESVELSHNALIAQLSLHEARFRVAALETRLRYAEEDVAGLSKILNAAESDSQRFGEAVLRLVRLVASPADRLNKYKFLAARALEIYTYKDLSGSMRFEWGSLPPDAEQNFVDMLETNTVDVSSINEFLMVWRETWFWDTDLLDFRNQYDKFSNGNMEGVSISHDIHDVVIDNAHAIDAFRENPTLPIHIKLEDLYANRYSAKAVSVQVAFVGANSPQNSVTTQVTHTGRYVEKDLNGTVHEFSLGPQVGFAQAIFAPLIDEKGVNRGGNPASGEGNFKNRGLAGHWKVSIEPDVFDRRDAAGNRLLDLSGLTRIEVSFLYRVFAKTSALAGPRASSILPADGSLIRSESTADVFLLKDGFKYRVEPGVDTRKVIRISPKLMALLPYANDADRGVLEEFVPKDLSVAVDR